jgi:hypothetical protein
LYLKNVLTSFSFFLSFLQSGHGRSHNVGKFDSKRKAALAYDRAAIRQGRPLSDLNFPNGTDHLPPESEEEDDYDDDQQANQNYINIDGYQGVSKYEVNGKKSFLASIVIQRDGATEDDDSSPPRFYLGLFNTIKKAARAYDEAVIQYNQNTSSMNYPNEKTYLQ